MREARKSGLDRIKIDIGTKRTKKKRKKNEKRKKDFVNIMGSFVIKSCVFFFGS